jgi:hypothetical protein
MRSFVALASVLLVFAPTAAVAQTDTTRTFEVRDIRLKDGESFGIQLHPTELPIEIESSEPDLEVCPNGWPSFAGFLECLPLDDGRLVLPSTVVATFHLGIRVQGIDRASVRVKELRITYEPGDGYFILQPPALAAGASTPALLVTPTTRDSVGVGLYGPNFAASDAKTKVNVRQSDRRVRLGGQPSNGRTDADYGPVKLDRAVAITVKNAGKKRATVELLIDWE